MVKTLSSDQVSAPKKEKRRERGGSADFGKEGSNKTIPASNAGAAPSGELQGTKTKYIPETPYTRG